jgi:archaemetzincin
MNVVQLLALGNVEEEWLRDLREAIPRSLHVACEILPARLDAAAAFHGERQQYHSSEMLQRMQPLVTPGSWRLLGVTDVDLYIPILKYVFGEAQMGGPCAVISGYRLRQELYGLERNDELFRERLRKEALHELGHTLGLRHCQDYRCVMASAHAVEWIDLRDSALCESCQALAT